MDTDSLETHLTNVLRRITDTPLPVANAFGQAFITHQIDPSDLQVLLVRGDRPSAMAELMTQNRILREENHRLKGAKGLTWEDFKAHCADHVDTKKPSWKNKMAALLGCAIADFNTWESMNRVPVALLKRVDALPDTQAERAAIRRGDIERTVENLVTALRHAGIAKRQVIQWLTCLMAIGDEASVADAITKAYAASTAEKSEKPQQRRDGYAQWSEHDYRVGLDILIAGSGIPMVMKALPAFTEGQINRKYNNDPPDEDLLGPIPIRELGPMSYLELWKIGTALYGESWKNALTTRLGLNRTAIQWNDPAFTPVQCAELRNEWHKQQAEPPGRRTRGKDQQAYRMFESIARTYPAGASIPWMEVVIKMRENGTGVGTERGPEWGRRFNTENKIRLFKVRQ